MTEGYTKKKVRAFGAAEKRALAKAKREQKAYEKKAARVRGASTGAWGSDEKVKAFLANRAITDSHLRAARRGEERRVAWCGVGSLLRQCPAVGPGTSP